MLQAGLNFFSNDKSTSVAWTKRICLCFVLHSSHLLSFNNSDTISLIEDSLSDLGIVDNFSFLSPSSWVLLVSSSLGATPLELPEAEDDLAVFKAVDDKKL